MNNKLYPIHKKISELPAFLAGDHTLLKEVLHPKNDGIELPFSVASASLESGTRSLPHRLQGSETYYFTSGTGSIFIENEEIKIAAGHLVLVPPNALQWVRNNGETVLEFLCIVSPAWSEEEEEVL